MMPKFADSQENAVPIDVITKDAMAHFLQHAPKSTADWAVANGFEGKLGQVVLVPEDGAWCGCW